VKCDRNGAAAAFALAINLKRDLIGRIGSTNLIVRHHSMNAKKLRRQLMKLCVSLFIVWIITTFPIIVLWYAKGGGHAFAPDVSNAWHMYIFDIIPGLTSGYLLFGLCVLNLILKSKSSSDETPDV